MGGEMAKIALIIAPETFRDEELFEPLEELTEIGHTCDVVSTHLGECVGKLGGVATATRKIADVSVQDYDAIAFIGGGGCRVYFDHPEAERIIQETQLQKMPLGAICLAPMILARAGRLNGLNVTVTESEKDQIGSYGATYVGPGVVMDDLVVTANGPIAARSFGRALARLV